MWVRHPASEKGRFEADPSAAQADEARAAGFGGEANPPWFDSGEKESLPLRYTEGWLSGLRRRS